jgi:hypothetical protein
MYNVNAKIKTCLVERGFTDLYLFPHFRYMKDYIVSGMGFDAIGWMKNEFNIDDKQLYLFQFKGNLPCSKKTLVEYKKLAKKYNAVFCWVTFFNKNKLTKSHPCQIEFWEVNSKEVKKWVK